MLRRKSIYSNKMSLLERREILCVCVCERERERERMNVCVREREREKRENVCV